MRILCVTNFYPPHALGGQGQSCQQVVEGLQQRGHQALVLTSRHGTGSAPLDEDGVVRGLYLEMELAPWRHVITFFTDRRRREKHNLEVFRRCAHDFSPDVVFIWGMWNLPRSLPAYIEQYAPERTLYRFADYWPSLPSQHQLYWQQTGRKWYSRIPKKVVGRLALSALAREDRDYLLRFKHAYCVSAATRKTLIQSDVPLEHARVIYTGLEVQSFLPASGEPSQKTKPSTVQILYAGRLEPTKGVDTAIAAMAKLTLNQDSVAAHLKIAGSGSEKYETQLRELVFRHGLNESVTFLGQVPSQQMAPLLEEADILVVPSQWQEPFARVVLEGMVTCTAVVATPLGGSSEIIKDGQNGLLFAPGDSADLARKLELLIADPDLRQQLGRCGYETVMGNFTFERMLDEIETYLEEIAEGAPNHAATLEP